MKPSCVPQGTRQPFFSTVALALLATALCGIPDTGRAQSAPFASPLGIRFEAGAPVLTGFALPNGAATTAWFEWGTNGLPGVTTTISNVGSGTTVVWVRAALPGLATTEHLWGRLVASNGFGVVTGATRPFALGESISIWSQVPTNLNQSWPPQRNVLTSLVAQAVGGSGNTLALLTNGHLLWWGSGRENPPPIPANLTNVVAIAARGSNYVALRADGTVRAWGGGSLALTNVTLNGVLAIAAGQTHSLALRTNGTLHQWGSGIVPSGVTNVVAIAAGNNFSVALLANGTVRAWGVNDVGQTNVPAALSNVVAIAAGADHALAVRTDGTVVGWGSNSPNNKRTPPATATNVVTVAAGYYNSAALRADGSVVSWGGDLGFPYQPQPTNLGPAVAVSAGDTWLLALANQPPLPLTNYVITVPANRDTVLTLAGRDPNFDALTFAIVTPPTVGALYQFNNGARGPQITAGDTPVTDPAGRVIFTPATNQWGMNHATLEVRSRDARAASPPYSLTVHVVGEPHAHTRPPVRLGSGEWELRGAVVPNGLPTLAWFEWGTRGQFTTASPPVVVEGGAIPVSMSLTVPELLTHFPSVVRVVASNAAGLRLGADRFYGATARIIHWGNNTNGVLTVPEGVFAVATGSGTNCALRADGQVLEWPVGTSGPPSPRAGLTNLALLAAGESHFVGVRADGTVTAWGNPAGNRLAVPAGLTNVVAVDANNYHSLALRTDGSVAAWGTNGIFVSGLTNVPTDLGAIVAVAAGREHSLALRADGTLVGWGWNKYGQSIPPATATNVVAIAAGFAHSLALQNDGTVVAWGYSGYGQTNLPVGLSNVIAIAARENSSLALTRDSRVFVWGQKVNGINNVPPAANEAWLADHGGSHAAALIPGRELPFATVAAPVLTNDGTAYLLRGDAISYDPDDTPPAEATRARFAWGTNGPPDQFSPWFTLLPGTNAQELTWLLPVVPTNRVGVFRLVVSNRWGEGRSAWRPFAGPARLAGWGAPDAVQLRLPANGPEWVQITGGASHGVAVSAAGATLAWGDNAYGQTNLPIIGAPVAEAAAGDIFTLLLDRNGNVYGAGWNLYGQVTIPTSATNIVQIAAGRVHCLALRRDGQVVAWGNGSYGAITLPPGLQNVTAIAAGWGQSLALQANGRVVSWGYDVGGSAAATLTNVAAIAYGYSHFLTLLEDGTVRGWGAESYGARDVPPGLSNVVAIAAGRYESFALRPDGSVVAWGLNDNGSLNLPGGPALFAGVAKSYGSTLALGGNFAPVAYPATNSLFPNTTARFTLVAFDPNGDSLTRRIETLPVPGTLRQNLGGTPGAPISASGTAVADPAGIVFYQPAPHDWGMPYANFSFLASDGMADSAPAVVTLNVPLPPAPGAESVGGFRAGQPPGEPDAPVFQLDFTGASDALYRVWASTNLTDWELLGPATPGSNGWHHFTDPAAAQHPLRFYRPGAP